MELVRQLNQAPYASIESGPRPLAVREPVPLLALPALIVDPHLEEVEKKLGATQLEFQEAIIKQMQSLTDQMSLMIRSQQPGLPPLNIQESSKHSSRFWCVQCQQPDHTRQFCKNRSNICMSYIVLVLDRCSIWVYLPYIAYFLCARELTPILLYDYCS